MRSAPLSRSLLVQPGDQRHYLCHVRRHRDGSARDGRPALAGTQVVAVAEVGQLRLGPKVGLIWSITPHVPSNRSAT